MRKSPIREAKRNFARISRLPRHQPIPPNRALHRSLTVLVKSIRKDLMMRVSDACRLLQLVHNCSYPFVKALEKKNLITRLKRAIGLSTRQPEYTYAYRVQSDIRACKRPIRLRSGKHSDRVISGRVWPWVCQTCGLREL